MQKELIYLTLLVKGKWAYMGIKIREIYVLDN